MADGKYGLMEIRFDVRDPNVTKMYVYIEADQHCPHTIQGWHYKEYPASLGTLEIMGMFCKSQENDPIFWPHRWPDAQEYVDCGEVFETTIQTKEGERIVHEHLSPEMKKIIGGLE